MVSRLESGYEHPEALIDEFCGSGDFLDRIGNAGSMAKPVIPGEAGLDRPGLG